MEHIKQILTALGIEEAKADEVIALPDDKRADFKPDEIVSLARTAVGEQLRNDPKFWEGLDDKNLNPDFLKKVEAQQYGRAANIVRQNLLKGFGMTEKDFEDLGEEGKKIEVFSKAFTKKLSEGKVTDKELQSQLIAARTRIEELEGQIPAKETEIKTALQSQFNNEKFDFIVLANVSGIPGLKVPAHYVSDKIAATLKNDYAFELNGTNAELRQKSNPQLKVLDGAKEVTLKDAITKILKADGLIDEKAAAAAGGGGKAAGTVTVEVGEGKGLALGHVSDKIQQRLKEEAAATGK